MDPSQLFVPAEGWPDFKNSPAFEEALWKLLPQTEWHYLNFTVNSSLWESRHDASFVRVHYFEGKVVEFEVAAGIASKAVAGLVTQFRLLPHHTASPSIL